MNRSLTKELLLLLVHIDPVHTNSTAPGKSETGCFTPLNPLLVTDHALHRGFGPASLRAVINEAGAPSALMHLLRRGQSLDLSNTSAGLSRLA